MTYIPSPQRTGNKICGDFYPLQKEELIALYKAKLINSTAFVHFALRCENPFCDRPITVIIKEFAMRWSIPEPSLYKSLAKLKESGIIKFNAGKVTIEWELSNPIMDYQIGEKIIKSDNGLSNPIMDYQIGENRPPETLQSKDHKSPQTLQTDQTPQTGGGEQKNFTGLEEILNKEIIAVRDVVPDKEKVVPRVVQDTTVSTTDNGSKGNAPVLALTTELIASLEAFNIPLDGAVSKAITNHHPSQVWGAIRHIENTWETIENPRAIFLYQVPKQPIEKPLKEPLTPEFLEWYNEAISKGLVKNISPETLPINQFREPKVYLPDNRLEDWQKVAAGEVQPLANPELMADFFKKAREGLRNAAAKK